MARKVGRIIARGNRRWLIEVYLPAIMKPKSANTTIGGIHGPMREAQAYLGLKQL
jgi:hypothetical protein